MDANTNQSKSSFYWNGGWFGSQFGGSAWMLASGISLVFFDAISAFVCLAGFVVVNIVGFRLWQSRETLDAYVGIQRLFLTMTAVYAMILALLNYRGMVSAQETFLGIVLPPALIVICFLRERVARQNRA